MTDPDWQYPPPGSFGLATIQGVGGAVIAGLQALTGDGSRFTHAFVVVDGGSVVEAVPSGAQLAPLAKYTERARVYADVRFTDAPVQAALADFEGYSSLDQADPLADQILAGQRDAYERNLRAALSATARNLVGTPYSFADYLALAALHLKLPVPRVRAFVASSGHMICSQLVDAVYCRNGLHLFTDGRPSQDVTPGDLDRYRVEVLERLQPRGA